eukprot:7742228-Pyramimonas_sp.AAC.1
MCTICPSASLTRPFLGSSASRSRIRMPACTGGSPRMPPAFFGLAQFIILAAPFLLITGAEMSAACARKRDFFRTPASRWARAFIQRATVPQ